MNTLFENTGLNGKLQANKLNRITLISDTHYCNNK